MTTVTIDYDCPNACRYDIPTTLAADQSALHHASLVDTLAALVDAQHDRECPTHSRPSSPPADRGRTA